mmetsp:Transcript_9946/g.28061  ORF Transcript_9946/g.28061 Transcript_9946/m.28061 type:complete len:233 (-) Transcript_9946:432-1130(-)
MKQHQLEHVLSCSSTTLRTLPALPALSFSESLKQRSRFSRRTAAVETALLNHSSRAPSSATRCTAPSASASPPAPGSLELAIAASASHADPAGLDDALGVAGSQLGPGHSAAAAAGQVRRSTYHRARCVTEAPVLPRVGGSQSGITPSCSGLSARMESSSMSTSADKVLNCSASTATTCCKASNSCSTLLSSPFVSVFSDATTWPFTTPESLCIHCQGVAAVSAILSSATVL